jgi:thioredoxin reductase
LFDGGSADCGAVGEIEGQAGTTSPIRNYLGFPRGISGRRLALSASQQSTFFGAVFVYGGRRDCEVGGLST